LGNTTGEVLALSGHCRLMAARSRKGGNMREYRGFWTMYVLNALILTIVKDVNDFPGIVFILIASLSLTILIMQFVAIRESNK